MLHQRCAKWWLIISWLCEVTASIPLCHFPQSCKFSLKNRYIQRNFLNSSQIMSANIFVSHFRAIFRWKPFSQQPPRKTKSRVMPRETVSKVNMTCSGSRCATSPTLPSFCHCRDCLSALLLGEFGCLTSAPTNLELFTSPFILDTFFKTTRSTKLIAK